MALPREANRRRERMSSREELIGGVETFLDALGHNDPSRLPATANVKYTENCQTLPLGKGMWATATPHRPAKLFTVFAEPDARQVGYFGVAYENGKPSLISARLKVDGGLVSEIEVLVARSPEESGHPRVFAPENMTEPRGVFDEVLAPSERCPRDEMLRITNLYFDGIVAGKGEMIPVLDECRRIENGVQTVLNPGRGTPTGALGVVEQVNTGVFRDIEAARDRRFPIVDEERGLVFAIFLFDHPGPVTNSGFVSRYSQPNSMMVAELFQIRNRKIYQIEAVLNVFPYGTKAGWE
jgi:hypothetical protein